MIAQPTLSIIIPMYKVEPYLRTCLDSIVSQTLQPYEVLLVDDGSPDRSGEIAQEYASNFPFFRYLRQPNGGVSKARNLGLKHATGAYVTFCDSDDLYAPTFYAEAIRLITEHESDLYRIGYLDFTADQDPEPLDSQSAHSASPILYTEEDIYEGGLTFPFMVVWVHLFKMQHIQELGLQFDESLRSNEDTLFVSSYLKGVKQLVYFDKPLYFHLIDRPDSITGMYKTEGLSHSQSFLSSAHSMVNYWSWSETSREPPYAVRLALYTTLKMYVRCFFSVKPLLPVVAKEVKKNVLEVMKEAKEAKIHIPQHRKLTWIANNFRLYHWWYTRKDQN